MRTSPPITTCEACGTEMEDMVTELRKFKIQNPGRNPVVIMASLRAPFWCEPCIETSGKLIKTARIAAGELEETPPLADVIAIGGDRRSS